MAGTLIRRRDFCSLLGGFVVLPLREQDKPLSSAELQDQATRWLVRGRKFETAAQYLLRAAQQEPKEPSHFLALGCAYASRIVSLTYAAAFTYHLAEAQASYGSRLKTWEQEKLEKDWLEKPELPPNQTYPTKDDGIAFRLTQAQLESRVAELIPKACSAWEKGIALSAGGKEKAQAFYIQGWGIRVLRKYLVPVIGTDGQGGKVSGRPALALAPSCLKELPAEAAILEAFDKAIDAEPDNPLYWQTRGDALEALGKRDEATSAYQKALDVSPKNAANLRYLLYARAMNPPEGEYETPFNTQTPQWRSDWDNTRELLRQAQASDPGNAWPLYEEAFLLFRYAPYVLTSFDYNRVSSPEQFEARRAVVRTEDARKTGHRAIDLIVQGNGTRRYQIPIYRDSVPSWLAAAWSYAPYGFDVSKELSESYSRARALSRSGNAYALTMQEEKNPDEAERAIRAAINMGKTIAGDWSLEDNPRTGQTVLQTLVGIVVSVISYRGGLVKLREIQGDAERLAKAKRESEAFQQRYDEFREASQRNFRFNEFTSY
jgi:tetratricopeptide (TPR) repeat protein